MSALVHLRHFLVPHESNNHKAKVLHPGIISLFALFIISLHALLPSVSKLNPNVLGYAYNIPAETVVELTNNERVKAGLPALEFNATLAASAKAKAIDMFEKDYWAHNAPDGTQPWKFFSDANYQYRYAGENLARDFTTADDALKAWMESPTHKENLLSRRYKEIGIAVVDGNLKGVETTLIVQHFGTQFGDTLPATTPEAPQISLEIKGDKTQGAVDDIKKTSANFLLSPLAALKGASGLILAIVLGVLAIDIFIVRRANIFRLSSKSSAHFLFLGMVLIAVIAARVGGIL
ncbi:MAG: CAP domain-containing protein [bacterium]|nr:CAP domain-containing protein [bacterium]